METPKQLKEAEAEEALQRQAVPMHEQPTQQFDSLAYLRALQHLPDSPFIDAASEIDCVHWEDDL